MIIMNLFHLLKIGNEIYCVLHQTNCFYKCKKTKTQSRKLLFFVLLTSKAIEGKDKNYRLNITLEQGKKRLKKVDKLELSQG